MNFCKKKKNGKLIFIIFIFMLISITISLTNTNPKYYSQKGTSCTNESLNNPIGSEYWDETEINFIHIKNDNWSAIEIDWIQNDTGSWNTPHVIENITINAGNYGIGILIEDCSDYFIIQNCTIYNSSKGQSYTAGIYLKNSNNGTIFNNDLSYNNGSGMIIENSVNITVSENYITNNSVDGISIFGQSRNITVFSNDIVNNTKKGLNFNSTASWNIIYRNNFINNGINAMDNGTDNQWYKNKIGNYWDDYIGCDTNRDNIGEWPYDILGEAAARDLYPICYKSCIFKPRKAKDSIEDEDEELISSASEIFKYFRNNIGLLATWIIGIEIITGVIVIINKKRKNRLSDENFW